jgi:hypothetical protein
MNFGVDFKEPSTTRGIIMIIASIFVGIAWLMGKDVTPIIGLAMGGSGLSGFFTKDSKSQK